MKKTIAILALFLSVAVFAQNEQLAANYMDKGEFEKALVIYEELAKKQPSNLYPVQKMVACLQQLKRYEEAGRILEDKLDKTGQPLLYVEIGYNWQLQKDMAKAEKNYKAAVAAVADNPSFAYTVARNFDEKVLLEYALKTYQTATEINKSLNFDYQMAILQGQMGNMDLMIEKLLDYAYNDPEKLPIVQNQLTRFMNEESQETFIAALRKALLVRTQKGQDIFWNKFLSWLYVQQKEYGKAFVQEKAIVKRDPDMIMSVVNLAFLAAEENDKATAKEIFSYILETSRDADLQLRSHYELLSMDIEESKPEGYAAIRQRFDNLLKEYGLNPHTAPLQVLKAEFEGFYLKDTKAAVETLEGTLKMQLNRYQMAEAKMMLSDILLLDEKFNQATIYYAQVEEDLKNDAVGHEASLKVAQASYYKGDFEWAQSQLKVLKSSSSQLIANDALQLYLLIIDNTVEDSTQTALKKFAKADFKLYQKKKDEALAQFIDIRDNDKTESIKDITLLRIGKIYEDKGEYDLSLQHYQKIIDTYKEGIYVDEALFFAAEIYNKKLNDPEKAKPLYEKLLFEHDDSIYFVEARKQFRLLRGDAAS